MRRAGLIPTTAPTSRLCHSATASAVIGEAVKYMTKQVVNQISICPQGRQETKNTRQCNYSLSNEYHNHIGKTMVAHRREFFSSKERTISRVLLIIPTNYPELWFVMSHRVFEFCNKCGIFMHFFRDGICFPKQQCCAVKMIHMNVSLFLQCGQIPKCLCYGFNCESCRNPNFYKFCAWHTFLPF